MKTFKNEDGSEIKDPKRYKHLTEIRNNNNRLLYHLNFWDGPLSGVMLWEGERVFFNCIDTFFEIEPWTEEEINNYKDRNKNNLIDEDYFDYNQIRIFAVYRIEANVMESIDYNHERFRTYVGYHTDYNEEGKREIGNLKPSKLHDEFYKKPDLLRKYELNLKDENILGYFEY